MDGEEDDDPSDRNYQVSEADDERDDDEESVTPQFEQEYQEMEIPASEFYENYDEEGEKESMAVMTVMPMDRATDVIAASDIGPKPKGPVEKDNRNFRIRSSGKLRERPQVKPEDKECLATWTKVGDLEAWTLWDSGSTTSGITPSYAELAKIVVDTLTDPHVLQLGTVGSRSIIKFGADISLRIAKQLYSSYVDVANFDRYDMIIGTPFMRKHGVLLDFKRSRVIINDMVLPAIRIELGDGDARLRRYRAMDKKKKQE